MVRFAFWDSYHTYRPRNQEGHSKSSLVVVSQTSRTFLYFRWEEHTRKKKNAGSQDQFNCCLHNSQILQLQMLVPGTLLVVEQGVASKTLRLHHFEVHLRGESHMLPHPPTPTHTHTHISIPSSYGAATSLDTRNIPSSRNRGNLGAHKQWYAVILWNGEKRGGCWAHSTASDWWNSTRRGHRERYVLYQVLDWVS